MSDANDDDPAGQAGQDPGFADAGRIGARRANAPMPLAAQMEACAAQPVAMSTVAAAGPMDPHQALLTGRARHLDDAIVLRLLLGVVTAGTSQGAEANDDLAETLMTRFASVAGALCATPEALAGIRDLGRHVAPALALLHDAALRYNRARMVTTDILSDQGTLLDYLTARLARETVEQFRIVFLDDKGALLADEAQARGTVNHTPVYPREVARRAIELKASSLVLVHNHPSGDPTPSAADHQMTAMVARAVEAVGVRIADHIIIGNGRHTSFRDIGAL